MTKHEAILKMMEGEKVTHELFHDGEYLFMKGVEGKSKENLAISEKNIISII